MKHITAHILILITWLTIAIIAVLEWDVRTAQRKNDIKPVVIQIQRADYVSMITGPQVEWDIKEGK